MAPFRNKNLFFLNLYFFANSDDLARKEDYIFVPFYFVSLKKANCVKL